MVTKGGEEKERACDPGQLTAYVFKTVSDPYVGHITMFRVFADASGLVGLQRNEGNEDRIGQLFALRGKEHETLRGTGGRHRGRREARAHDDRDTFSTKDDPVTLLPIQMPEPLLAFAITPKTKGDEDKLSTALSRLREEDPTLRIERSDETHETVMYGMGEAPTSTSRSNG